MGLRPWPRNRHGAWRRRRLPRYHRGSFGWCSGWRDLVWRCSRWGTGTSEQRAASFLHRLLICKLPLFLGDFRLELLDPLLLPLLLFLLGLHLLRCVLDLGRQFLSSHLQADHRARKGHGCRRYAYAGGNIAHDGQTGSRCPGFRDDNESDSHTGRQQSQAGPDEATDS